MPQITNELIIEDYGEQRSSGRYLFIDSRTVIEQLENIGFEEVRKIPKGSRGRRIAVSIPADDARWQQILNILKAHGMTWYPHYSVESKQTDKFVFWRYRAYTREEICASELLRITGATKPFADFRTDETGDGFLVEVNRRLNNQRDFGTSYYDTTVLMSERLKLHLEADKLVATNFKPVCYDKPLKPDTKRLWQFESTVRMPACLTLRQADDGSFVTQFGPPKVGGYYWDDAGYIPAELAFKREDVGKLPLFDIAMTQEFVGQSYASSREIIVTQRFREAMEKHGVKTAEWAPVRLV